MSSSASSSSKGDNRLDRVIKEIDVFLTDYLKPNDTVMKKVCLLQYPLRPSYVKRPLILDAKYKTRTKRLKLENILNDTNSYETFDDNDPSEGDSREVEINSWKQIFDPNSDHDVYLAELQTLISTSIAMKTSLAVGVLGNNALYLTPITDVMQMRPSFKHLKVIEKDDRDDNDDQSSSRYNSKAKKNMETLTVKRQDMNRSSGPRLQYFSNLVTDEENEAWADLKLLKECTEIDLHNLKSYVETSVRSSNNSIIFSSSEVLKSKSKPKSKKDSK